jgi:hypothetical protein
VAVILVLEGSLDFKREIVVHLKHHIKEVEILLLATPVVADHGPQYDVNFAEVERALGSEVGIDHGSSEDKAGSAPAVLCGPEELEIRLVRLIAIVETVVGFVPSDIVTNHLNQKVLVLRVLSGDTSGVCLSEDVLAYSPQEEQVPCTFHHF